MSWISGGWRVYVIQQKANLVLGCFGLKREDCDSSKRALINRLPIIRDFLFDRPSSVPSSGLGMHNLIMDEIVQRQVVKKEEEKKMT